MSKATINELALKERGRGIQSLFTHNILPIVLSDEHPYTNFRIINMEKPFIEGIIEKDMPVTALRIFRSTVAHESAHNFITKPDAESWNGWYNGSDRYEELREGNLKHLIGNIIEDRRVEFAVTRRYKAYALAQRTKYSYVYSQSYDEKDSETLYRNALVQASILGKVKSWGRLSKRAQKSLLFVKDILDGADTGAKEHTGTKDMPVELIWDFNVLVGRAKRIYEIVAPFFAHPQMIPTRGNLTRGRKGGASGGKKNDSKSASGQGDGNGQGGQGGQSGLGLGADLKDIDRSDYDKTDLPKPKEGDYPKSGYGEDVGIIGILVKGSIDAEELQKAIAEFGAEKGATEGEKIDIKKLFGIDISEEFIKAMEKARRDAIFSKFGEHRITVPESNYEEYARFRTPQVEEQINKLKRIKLEEAKLRKKVRTVESGGLLNPSWANQYLQRDDKLFFERRRSLRDVAWAVLVDVSGSVDMEEVIQAFIVLSEVGKDVVGDDRLLLASFSDNYFLVKDLNEHVDRVVKGRVGNCYHGGCTNICCSIEKTAYRLSKSSAERKVMIIVSDGHHNTCELPIGDREHIPKAILNAKRSGIIVIHIKLGYSRDLPNVPHTEIEDISQLADKFVQIYKRITWVR